MEKHYKKIFITIIAVKLILAWLFPITSDEAYFYTWTKQLDVNFYDHPPMTGWAVWLAVGIFFIVKDIFKDHEKAAIVSLSFLVAPLHILFFPISTDSPLFVFVFISGAFFFFCLKPKKNRVFLFCGIFYIER